MDTHVGKKNAVTCHVVSQGYDDKWLQYDKPHAMLKESKRARSPRVLFLPFELFRAAILAGRTIEDSGFRVCMHMVVFPVASCFLTNETGHAGLKIG